MQAGSQDNDEFAEFPPETNMPYNISWAGFGFTFNL